MKMLTTGDVLEVIGPLGISREQLRTWCKQGIIVPAEAGDGAGTYRQFTLMRTVGLAVAAKVLAGEQGRVAAYVGKVVAAFAGMTEAALMK